MSRDDDDDDGAGPWYVNAPLRWLAALAGMAAGVLFGTILAHLLLAVFR